MKIDTVSASEVECHQAIAEMQSKVPVEMQCDDGCIPYEACGGWINVIELIIHINQYSEYDDTLSFHKFVIVHEYAHWFDFTHLDDISRGNISGYFGWSEWRYEAYADVVAQCLGMAVGPLGHRYSYPDSPQASESDCEALRAASYLPKLGSWEEVTGRPPVTATPVVAPVSATPHKDYPPGPTHKLLGHWTW